MSNHLAVATVSAALSQLLQVPLEADVPGASVRFGKPEPRGAGAAAGEVSLFLYQVTGNTAFRSEDLPSRRSDGSLARTPRAALDLHYLLSFQGDEVQLEPQRLLGSVVRTLHARPVLTRQAIRDAVVNPAFSWLAGSNLAEQTELVKFAPVPMSLEELSRLWSVFFQVPYSLSVAYTGTVVLIDSEETPRPAPPVRERSVYAIAAQAPVIDSVEAAAGGEAIVAGGGLRILGRQLKGDLTRVFLAGVDREPSAAAAAAVEMPVPQDLPAGPHAVQVVHYASIGNPPAPHRVLRSNVGSFVLRPTLVSASASQDELSVEVAPPAGPDQRTSILLDSSDPASPVGFVLPVPVRPAAAAVLNVPLTGVTGLLLFRPGSDRRRRKRYGFWRTAHREHSMTSAARQTFADTNQRYLAAELNAIRGLLEQKAAVPGEARPVEPPAEAPPSFPEAPIEVLTAAFGMSRFERRLLLLCAAMDLDSSFAPLCAAAQGSRSRDYPTFGLALGVFSDAHWSAIVPTAPLRRWRFIEVGSNDPLTAAPLRIDERVLHYIAGMRYTDERIDLLLEPMPAVGEIPESWRQAAARIARVWLRPETREAAEARPVPLLRGAGPAVRAAAAAVCAGLGASLAVLRAQSIPAAPAEREILARLLERKASLSGTALLIECDGSENAQAASACVAFAESLQVGVLLASSGALPLGARPHLRIMVPEATPAEQREAWVSALGVRANGMGSAIDRLVGQFNVEPGRIAAIARSAPLEDGGTGREEDEEGRGRFAAALWDGCRESAAGRFENLASRVESSAAWTDLVLPEPSKDMLRQVASQIRRRFTVHGAWGFEAKGSRGLGVGVLFAGPSGTGKTMAAEVLARDLDLDLYRIDLSQIVSKYIGDTEKNLRRIFEAAGDGGVVLFFDEADALFGRRTEVRDSHDRYANIEVSYLLQLMESYRGLAILATNMRSALDAAFLRRLRFVVQFPFPDAAQRAEIWRNIFPAATPREGLDFERLARLNLTGGNIRSIALNAAFLAADEECAVGMPHVLRAARAEYAKLERPLAEIERAR